jgi:hypothetical protein
MEAAVPPKKILYPPTIIYGVTTQRIELFY